ncbi:MAG TPA: leucyl aminopeptidase [Patescibacteria group bacterium]|jgi:leucyl aminopeptidase
MKFHVSKTIPRGTDAFVVSFVKGKGVPKDFAAYLSAADLKDIDREAKRRKAKGTVGEQFLLPAPQGLKCSWLLVAGVGTGGSDEDIRKINGSLAPFARQHHLYSLALMAPPAKSAGVLSACAEGLLLGDYKFTKHKSGKARKPLGIVAITPKPTPAYAAALKRAWDRGRVTAEAQVLARDLANEPPSHLTPKQFAKEARVIAKQSGLGISVLGPAEMKRAGLGATLAVAKGSDEPPQFIKLTYRPKTRSKKHVVLVGKSVTYDAGGINIKPTRGGSLESMKLDMSGGAAVLGAMSALKKLGVKHRVTGYLPAVENLLGGAAYKPGDVVKTFNGKTIEVGNTDAEGRLTLADALAHTAAKDKPDEIIDLATLTATDISLGPSYAAIFATKPGLEKKLREAGERTGEKVWPLPFPAEYDDMTKSEVADFSNIVSGRAYTLSGPLLLKHFVGTVPWVHLDIGGPATPDRDSGYTKKGGSGFGTRLLLEYLSNA